MTHNELFFEQEDGVLELPPLDEIDKLQHPLLHERDWELIEQERNKSAHTLFLRCIEEVNIADDVVNHTQLYEAGHFCEENGNISQSKDSSEKADSCLFVIDLADEKIVDFNFCKEEIKDSNFDSQVCSTKEASPIESSINLFKTISKASQIKKKTNRAAVAKKLTKTLIEAKEKRSRKWNYSRWGRKEDIEAYDLLSTRADQSNFNIQFVLMHYSTDVKCTEIIDVVTNEKEWKGSTPAFITRIKNLWKNNHFSIRDRKLLRKTGYKMIKNHGKIDYKVLASYFPGKSIESVQNEYNKGFKDLK